MTIPGAALRFLLTLGLLVLAPVAVSAGTYSGASGSHSFQRSDLQMVSGAGSKYAQFGLYSRFSATFEAIGDRPGRLDEIRGVDTWPPLDPGPIFVEPPILVDPPVREEPPVYTEPPPYSDPPAYKEPPAFADDPPSIAEPPTLLLIGTGLLAAASTRKRRLR